MFENIPEVTTIRTEVGMYTFISTFTVHSDRSDYARVVMHGRDIASSNSSGSCNFYLPAEKRLKYHNEFVEETFKRIMTDG